MTCSARVRRVLLWALAGVVLSPVVGAPLWALTGEDKVSDALPVATAAVGLIAGLVALRYVIYLIGLVFVPIAISLTDVARFLDVRATIDDATAASHTLGVPQAF